MLSTWEKIFISSFGKKLRMEWKARFLNCRNEKECKCCKRQRRKLLYRIILLLHRKSLKNVQSNLFILIYNKPLHFSIYDSFNRKLLSWMLSFFRCCSKLLLHWFGFSYSIDSDRLVLYAVYFTTLYSHLQHTGYSDKENVTDGEKRHLSQ